MRYAIGPRREIGIRTIFNVLGPLTNPAGANIQVLGVYDPTLTEPLAEVLGNLGTRSAFVVYGEGSYDEISIVGPTRVSQLKDGQVSTYTIAPEDFGLQRATLEDIKGGDVFDNARIVRSVLAGEGGPREDMVALNAAAVFIAAGLSRDFPEGIKLSWETIRSGKALQKLEQLIAKSKSLSSEQ
jgi:anthranilate phosphoribosyltransferase